jgi:geranylgeranyl diphosphate synthase type II
VDGQLSRLLPPEDAWPATLHRAIRHSLFAGGKRLRPILCLTAAETVGGESDPALAPACGLEMIHTYSLIHDDLPALDNDDLRRGVPTCHVVFGEAIAILAGDALLTHGLGTLARYPEEEIYVAAKVKVVNAVVDAIGTAGMIGGQVADLEAEKQTHPSQDLVEKIHESKTGRLIRASLAVGGLLSFASEEDLARLDVYGRAVGLAFRDARQDLGERRGCRQSDVPVGLGRRAIPRDAARKNRRSDRSRGSSAQRRRTPS